MNVDDYSQDGDLVPVIPPDLSPEDALEVIIGLCYEMRHSVKKLEALSAILNDEHAHTLHSKAAEDLRDWLGGLRYILNIVYDYDKHRSDSTGHYHEDFF